MFRQKPRGEELNHLLKKKRAQSWRPTMHLFSPVPTTSVELHFDSSSSNLLLCCTPRRTGPTPAGVHTLSAYTTLRSTPHQRGSRLARARSATTLLLSYYSYFARTLLERNPSRERGGVRVRSVASNRRNLRARERERERGKSSGGTTPHARAQVQGTCHVDLKPRRNSPPTRPSHHSVYPVPSESRARLSAVRTSFSDRHPRAPSAVAAKGASHPAVQVQDDGALFRPRAAGRGRGKQEKKNPRRCICVARG